MKTLKLVTLVLGLLFFLPGYSYTLFNLPGEPIKNPLDNLNVSDNDALIIDVNKSEDLKSNTHETRNEDTIIINLPELIITQPFPASARECISKQVPYPSFAEELQMEGGVALSFEFDRDGRILIKDTYSSHPELEAYVVDRMQSMSLHNCRAEIGKEYFLRFMFRMK